MHPTHTIDVEATTNHHAGSDHFKAANLNQHHENGIRLNKEHSNAVNGNGDISSTNGTPQHNGSAGVSNGNTTQNGACGAYQQNGARRDSTQIWTPLLSNSQNGNGNNVIVGINGGESNGSLTPAEPATTVLYSGVVVAGTPSNNNQEWKDAEEINNLRNGLLHQPPPPHHNQPHLHQHHHNHHHHQGNNNGSLMNGKNGLGLGLPDKYDEQDPLTGLYRPRHVRPSESDESDFDSDLNGGGSSGAGVGADRSKTPTCGLFGCRPKWARSFASTHVFMVVFLLAYILQGMYMTYFVSVITTIEKLFQIKSKTTGFLLSASEMGQISTAMLLTYFAGRGHRPRWIACGMVLFSIAAFACSLPHFIFGKELMHASDLLNSVNTGGSAAARLRQSEGQLLHSSFGEDEWNSTSGYDGERSTLSMMSPHDLNLCLLGGNSSNSSTECDEERKMEQASHSKITVIVLCIFFASLLSSGIGQTAVATLGIPYIDDNVASKQSPMYLAITIGVRILGPASGFIVGSFCTRWYVNFTNPGFDASDPRWIGAWWLGPVVIGSLMMLSSIAMFSFPKQLRGKRTEPDGEAEPGEGGEADAAANAAAAAEAEDKPKLKDFPKTVRRQLSNDILMFRTASCVFHLLPIAGLYTFLPKYLESQFHLATYDANMIAAFCGILVMGVGIVISGLVILKMKPSAPSVAAWIAFTALVYAAGMVILMFVGCGMDGFAGYKAGDSSSPAHIEPVCTAALNCTCDKEKFAPICGVDGKMYISSCHAGCSASDMRFADNRTVFSNCACIPDPEFAPDVEKYEAVSGYCDSNCKNFIVFILIFAVCVFMHSTSEVGSMLLVMRCTHPKDKAMAMGVIQSAIGLFGNVPCPIIYGAVVDSACLIWQTVCGKHGACSLYDADTFRHYFLGITAGFMFLAFIMDLIVWSKAHRIDIAPEDNKDVDVNDEDKASSDAECRKSASPLAASPDTSV